MAAPAQRRSYLRLVLLIYPALLVQLYLHLQVLSDAAAKAVVIGDGAAGAAAGAAPATGVAP